MTLTNDAKAAVALTTRLGSRQRPSLTPKMWHELSQTLDDAGYGPDAVFDQSVDLANVTGVGPDLVERIGRLRTDAAAALLEVDELRHRGIWTTTVFDDGYPQLIRERLGHNAPPVIFGAGNVGLLTQAGIGIVGSRNVSAEGGEVAKSLAREAVALNVPVVSGGARGVDDLAMNAAFGSGGSVVGVLADSLIGRIRKPDVLQALDDGNVCLLTQQAPSSGFTAGAAMSRNKIIYGLAAVTVVVASDRDSGGTWAGANEAIMATYGPVAVWRGEGEGPGNQALEDMGAARLEEPSDLADLLETPSPSEQMSLEL